MKKKKQHALPQFSVFTDIFCLVAIAVDVGSTSSLSLFVVGLHVSSLLSIAAIPLKIVVFNDEFY